MSSSARSAASVIPSRDSKLIQLHPTSWPIRWRLTALNVAVLVATIVALGGAFLLQLDNALIGIVADNLREQARPALQPGERRQIVLSPREQDSPEQEGRGDRPPPFSLSRSAGFVVRSLTGPDTGVRVFDATGRIVAESEIDEEIEQWPLPDANQVRATVNGADSAAVVRQDTRRTLVMLLPMRSPDGTVTGVLQLSRSLDLVQQLVDRLRSLLLLGMALAAVVAAALSLRVTRAALRPLDAVVRAARKIEAGELGERLRLERRDEVGELAEAFDTMLDRLSDVIAAQRRFVADAAHELRTPLTALSGTVEMLQMGADRGDKATVQRLLGSMEREIARLGRLVRDLLSLSRLDAEQPLVMAPVELGPLVSEVAAETKLLAKGQEVDCQIGSTPTVLGDGDRLKQALLNLAANALAFTPAQGRIKFELARTNGRARLTVSDTGPGIDPELLPRVMDRFVRADPSRSRSTGGSGLGLPIVRGIVEAHGGTITLESEPGRGTSAIIDLPIAQSTVNGHPAERRAASTHRPTA